MSSWLPLHLLLPIYILHYNNDNKNKYKTYQQILIFIDDLEAITLHGPLAVSFRAHALASFTGCRAPSARAVPETASALRESVARFRAVR